MKIPKFIATLLVCGLSGAAIAAPSDATRHEVNIASDIAIFETARAMIAAFDCDKPDLAFQMRSAVDEFARTIMSNPDLWGRKIDAELFRLTGYGTSRYKKGQCEFDRFDRETIRFSSNMDRLSNAIDAYLK